MVPLMSRARKRGMGSGLGGKRRTGSCWSSCWLGWSSGCRSSGARAAAAAEAEAELLLELADFSAAAAAVDAADVEASIAVSLDLRKMGAGKLLAAVAAGAEGGVELGWRLA